MERVVAVEVGFMTQALGREGTNLRILAISWQPCGVRRIRRAVEIEPPHLKPRVRYEEVASLAGRPPADTARAGVRSGAGRNSQLPSGHRSDLPRRPAAERRVDGFGAPRREDCGRPPPS